MRKTHLAPLVALLALGLAHPAAAYQKFCDVSQPMANQHGQRVEIHRVTYAFDLEAMSPGLEVQLTCHPGPIVWRGRQEQDSVSTSDITNQNIAQLLGVTIKVEARPPGTWSAESDSSAAVRGGAAPAPRFFVRDFRVELDVSSLAGRIAKVQEPTARRSQIAQFDALVTALVECVRDNARRSEPPIRTIRFSVVGWDRYRRHNQTMTIQPEPPAKHFGY